MKVFVGLGNPGEKYEKTRHNLGLVAVLKWQKNRLFLKRKKYEYQIIGKGREKIVLVKPLTFMNNSGSAVLDLMVDFKIPAKNLYVIHDDLDLKLGSFKIQFGKGPKKHGGINSIEKKLKTKDFWRIRLGVENRLKEKRMTGEDYVLRDFKKEEWPLVERMICEVKYLIDGADKKNSGRF